MSDINEAQEILRKTYCGGEFAHVETEAQADKVGDTLFAFMWRELADTDGDLEEASRLLLTAEGQIIDVRLAIEKAMP